MPVRIRSRVLALVLGLAWSLAWAETATAQARVDEKVNIVATGEITALDAEARTISVKGSDDATVAYQVDGSATIMSEADRLALGDLKPGWSVVLNGHRTGDTLLVTYIKVVKRP